MRAVNLILLLALLTGYAAVGQDNINSKDLQFKGKKIINSLEGKYVIAANGGKKYNDSIALQISSLKANYDRLSSKLSYASKAYLSDVNDNLEVLQQVLSEEEYTKVYEEISSINRDMIIKLQNNDSTLNIDGKEFFEPISVKVRTQRVIYKGSKTELENCSGFFIRANPLALKRKMPPKYTFNNELTQPDLKVKLNRGIYIMWAEKVGDNKQYGLCTKVIDYTMNGEELTLIVNE